MSNSYIIRQGRKAAIGKASIAVSHALSHMVSYTNILVCIMGYVYLYVICTNGDRQDRGYQVRLLYTCTRH